MNIIMVRTPSHPFQLQSKTIQAKVPLDLFKERLDVCLISFEHQSFRNQKPLLFKDLNQQQITNSPQNTGQQENGDLFDVAMRLVRLANCIDIEKVDWIDSQMRWVSPLYFGKL